MKQSENFFLCLHFTEGSAANFCPPMPRMKRTVVGTKNLCLPHESFQKAVLSPWRGGEIKTTATESCTWWWWWWWHGGRVGWQGGGGLLARRVFSHEPRADRFQGPQRSLNCGGGGRGGGWLRAAELGIARLRASSQNFSGAQIGASSSNFGCAATGWAG